MIRLDRREYHAAQSGRFVARPQLGRSNFQAPLASPPPDAGLELSLAERVGLGDYLRIATVLFWAFLACSVLRGSL